MPGSAEQKHLLSSPAALLGELGRGLPSRWCHCRHVVSGRQAVFSLGLIASSNLCNGKEAAWPVLA